MFLTAFLAPAAVHLMFGFDDVGLVEEWGVQLRFDAVGPVFWTPSDPGSLSAQSIRPLTVAPHGVAYALYPDSFAGYHLLHAVALGLKAAAMLLLLLRIPLSRPAAFTGAVLFGLMPAWDGMFSFRTIHMQFALAFFVFAVAELVEHHRRPSWPAAIRICLALAASLMLYEVAYVALGFAPLAVLVAGPRDLRSLARTVTVWFIAPVVNTVRIAILWATTDTLYQREITRSAAREPIREGLDLLSLVFVDGFRAFIDPPYGFVAFELVPVVVAVVVTATMLAATTLGRCPRTEAEAADMAIRPILALVAGAAVLAPVSALIYLPHPVHLSDPLRVFSIAGVGIAVCVAACFEVAVRASHGRGWLWRLGIVVSIAAVAGSVFSAGAQRIDWNRRSAFQENLVGAISSALPSPATESIVVVDPDLTVATDLYRFLPVIFGQAIDVVLPGRQLTVLCQTVTDVPDGSLVEPGSVPHGACVTHGNMITSAERTLVLDSSTVVEVRRTDVGEGWSGDPVDIDIARVHGMLDCVGHGTCDEGVEGVQARIVVGDPFASLPSPP